MQQIRSSNTKPEVALRKALHARGLRFRLHDRKLPRRPDIVLPKYRLVIFVHGCFWHCHDCNLFKWPKTREKFWREKIESNFERDRRTEAELKETGWRSLNIWECAMRGPSRLESQEVIERAAVWLRSNQPGGEIRGNEL